MLLQMLYESPMAIQLTLDVPLDEKKSPSQHRLR